MALKKRKAKKRVLKKKPLKKRAAKKVLKKKPARKATKKAVSKKKPVVTKAKKIKENVVGKITHYFPHVQAAVIKLKAPLAVGDTIKVKGHTTDFTQAISSLQINRVPVDSAKVGDEIGLLVKSRVRQHDLVYKV
jgi:putative protease